MRFIAAIGFFLDAAHELWPELGLRHELGV